MTISSQTREMTATGNGVTTVFPYTFIIPDADYAYLYLEVIATEVETLVSTNDYTLSGVGNPNGGNVTYNPSGIPLPATHRLILRRVVDYVQEASISTQSGFNAAVVEEQLDLQVMMIQQLAQGSDTALGETLAAIEVLEGLVDEAEDSMDAAAASATAAASSANDAAASAADAVVSAAEADASATASSGSAASAASQLAALQAGFLGTSTTTLTPGTGAKVFTTQAGLSFFVGQSARAINTAGDKLMDGIITAYSGTSLTLTVAAGDFYTGTEGSQWSIVATGARGTQGASGAGTGDVIGPVSSVANRIAIFSGTDGKTIADGGVLIAAVAPLASPTFTGTPAGPTAAGGTNTTQFATTAFVKAAIDVVLGGVAATYDTLAEIATGIGTMFGRDVITAGGAGVNMWAADSTDLDSLAAKTGAFIVQTNVNTPESLNSYWFVEQWYASSSFIKQIATPYNQATAVNNRMWVRSKISGTWTAWQELASLDISDQVMTGGFRTPVVSPTDPTNGSTFVPDPGDGAQQEITNNVAGWTLAPPTEQGALYLWITNGASAGTITEGAFTLIDGDPFDTTNGSKFLCTIAMTSVASYCNIRKLV